MDLPWRRINASLATSFTLIHKSHLSLAHYFRWVSCRAQVLKNNDTKHLSLSPVLQMVDIVTLFYYYFLSVKHA